MDKTIKELETAVLEAKAGINAILEKLTKDFPIIKDVSLSEESHPVNIPRPANRFYRITVLC